jgi:hypothetical protein
MGRQGYYKEFDDRAPDNIKKRVYDKLDKAPLLKPFAKSQEAYDEAHGELYKWVDDALDDELKQQRKVTHIDQLKKSREFAAMTPEDKDKHIQSLIDDLQGLGVDTSTWEPEPPKQPKPKLKLVRDDD